MYTLKALRLLVACSLLALVLSGCMVSSAGMSPSTTPIEKETRYSVLSNEDVSGSSWGVSLAGIINLSEISTARSRDRAIESAGADALIDVTTNNHMYMLPTPIPIYFYRVKVSGKPVKFTNL